MHTLAGLLSWLTPVLMCLGPTGYEESNVNFEEAFEKTVMEWEGGDRYHDVPGDPGGATRWGIAQRFHPDVDIRTLDRAGAEDFYRGRYWNAVRAEDLPPAIRWDIFDTAVNTSAPWHPTRAVRLLQTSVNLCNAARGRPPIAVDGQIGPQTLRAANALPHDRLQIVFKAVRARLYVELAEGGLAKFLEGWLRRTYA